MTKAAELIQVLNGLRDFDNDIDIWELPEEFETIDEGDWEVNHKYEYQRVIVKHMPTGLLFAIDRTRSGSYYSDYHYMDADVNQVEPVEVVRVEYRVVEQPKVLPGVAAAMSVAKAVADE